ncbi:MAG: hypothetical protein IKO67_04780 [Bacteroidaceae bacterium]|nr:hypothetical protein [Bacteroidaceae bacterium]
MPYKAYILNIWTKSIALIIMLFTFSIFTYADDNITIGGNVYGGGNRGDLKGATTVVIQSGTVEGDVYGGARMANVTPTTPKDTIVNGVTLSKDYATHVLIWGGNLKNVYGGNDITGNITGGTNVEIYSNVNGDVYGGGNGSYVYTDQSSLTDPAYADLHYDVPSGQTSAQALNDFRPNVDKTLVHITGKSATLTGSSEQTTYIGGRVFCGGNSATLRSTSGNPTANLRIGSHVVVDNVFLGSNGENMVNTDTLARYANASINSMNLTDAATFEEYMRGVDVGIKPTVSFDTDYVDETAYIGSFFVGGNVGSMSAAGTFTLNFPKTVVIYNKLVGGCNNANVAKSEYNAFHEGGLTTAASPKVNLNIDGLVLEPRTLDKNTFTLNWNKTADNMFIGGNIYGGCYASGYINGNVNINLTADAISTDTKAIANGTDVKALTDHRDNVFNTALSIFGAGYGEDSEIWGNTTITLSNNADIIKVFGGGEKGVVGNLVRSTEGARTGDIENPYNTTINLTAGNVGKIYGGGFEGPVTGHTTVNLIGGTAYDVIGGACNADIGEYAETYVGRATASTIPTVTNNIYGANDFGGTIKGNADFASHVTSEANDKTYNADLLKASAYIEYIKGKAHYIFGGAKAAYDYKDQTLYSQYTNSDGTVKNDFVKPHIGNAFINFRPVYAENSSVTRVYGGGQGYYNERDKDLLQDNSYVLVDIPADVEQFASMEVFGAGDYSGVGMDIAASTVRSNEESDGDITAAAVIDLVRGNINSVYGGSYKQGFTRRTIVNVPVGSTIDMNYLYGGAYGVASADGHTLGNLWPCDVYESNVNYKSGAARIRSIYGGNNSYRRTLYSHINIHTPVRYVHRTYGLTHANIFGAGYGENTWAQYTEVNLLDSAKVYEPYGGGEAGNVYNKESITSLAGTNSWSLNIPGDYSTTDAAYDHGGLTNALAHTTQLYSDYNSDYNSVATKYDVNIAEKYNTNVHIYRGATVVNYAYGAGYGSHIYTYKFDGNQAGNIEPKPGDYGASTADQLDAEARAKYDAALALYNSYNEYTDGSTVGANEYNSFNDTQKSHWTQTDHRTTAVVSGTSYIDLLGGTVAKDLYAAGTTGSVMDTLMLKSFTASSTAYIKGGSVRNVYGGGWEGPVGKHNAADGHTNLTNDVLGETNVIIGRPEEEIAAEFATVSITDPSFDEDEFFYFNGVPAIRRNAYAGGEGGVVRGTANLDIFNGVVGYQNKHKDEITASENNYYRLAVEDGHVKYIALKRGDDLSSEDYYFVEEIDQDAVGDNIMFEAGNAFGGGYAANSDVDIANITLWNGIIRNSMYGGGEIATIGRGTQAKNASDQFEVSIYKPGETHVTMMGGHVLRDVFGGGRGFNNWKTEDKSAGNTNGFIFGKTDVNIHYGTIGTLEGMSKGYGNVFGGGNVGFVYSQYAKQSDGWYYEDYSNKKLSEDTRVEVKAYGRALEDNVTVGGTTYAKGDYIPNTALDQLTNNDNDKLIWEKIDQSGITIYNAVFAGGNVSAGSDKIMAFSKTVYGNSTAAIVDIYSRDLISVGGKGVGGIYGDGNLTFVDGYRELNITNYGTDWYSLSGGVDSDAEFNALTPRQQSFYTTQYECTADYGDYVRGDIILYDVYILVDDEHKANWKRKQSIVNEGRFINTVQRCDFCGIKGSRLVLHGAIDRAQDEAEADFTNYTINRVGELSLNQNRDHGSYFGINNVVKFLGGVTSDVKFADVRRTNSAETGDYAADGSTTYFQWKKAHINDNKRNDGTAPNKIALSSGVFLEIVKELDNNGNKIYGPITGVVELDLLNVSPGEGGGYVYAKNIHGTPSYTPIYADVISDANENLVTNRAYTYTEATASDDMETSGNFIHSLPKRILDDCFPESKKFAGADASPAHYWYIRGEYYVYEQLVSAYTGGADAYNTEMSIPLTMSIQGNAKLRLLNIVPGLYADPAKLPNYTYNAEDPELSVSDSISIIKNAITKTYGQGDPISYWDWYNATTAERSMFIMDTDAYVCNAEATIDGRTYYPGEAISKSVYEGLAGKTALDGEGNPILDENTHQPVDAKSLFNVINEVSNNNGYLLTLDFSNPSSRDDYYRLIVDAEDTPIKKAAWNALSDQDKEKYVKSATFNCNASGTYGQYYFNKDDVISSNVYDMQAGVTGHVDSQTQASFESAYIAKTDCEVSINGTLKSFTQGTPISAADYAQINNASTYFEPAYICVSTVLVGTGDYRVLNQLAGKSEYDNWSSDIQEKFQQAYYCTNGGSWGGKYYEKNHNYNGVDYCQLLPEERAHFDYNYDALDALLYSNYEKNIGNGAYRYDAVTDYTSYINNVGGTNRNTAISAFDMQNHPFYATPAKIDYTATFNSSDTYKSFTLGTTSVANGVQLNNDQFESLPNDRKYYASFAVSDTHLKDKDGNDWPDGKYHTYIVKNTFEVAGTMYNAGKAISHLEYTNLTTTQQGYVEEVVLDSLGTYYFCIEQYKVGANDANITAHGSGIPDFPAGITAINSTTTYAKGDSVPVGTVIDANTMAAIPNYQTHFTITGETPIEETTLYVPVSANIDALQRDRYVTAIYEYTYTESDASGMNYETRVEKHIINIRIKFLSGTPVIGPIKEPDLVLPLETVGFDIPTIQEGAFPILGGGWEIYPNEDNAKHHRNGREYVNGGEPLYFYQNDYYVAYYALTRMGKTFSNPVPLHVANYQRMADVITDPHHMYINHRDNDRDPKIYISSRNNDTNGGNISFTDSYGVPRTFNNELDAMQGMWDIVNSTYGTEHQQEVNGKSRIITGAANLEFFLQGEVKSEMPSWASIGGGDATNPCFSGIFHGNGNTVTGLNNSLFGSLCGRVYNTGVMGNFTTGGIANTGDGRIENCWVWTSATPSGQAVYASPSSGARVINSYYPDVNSTFTGSTGNIEITERPVEDFVNGSLAYDLNRYYLEARYRLNGQKSDGSFNNHLFYRLPDGTMVKDETQQIEDANGKKPGETGYIPTYANLVHTVNYADADYTRFDKQEGATTIKVGYVEKYVADGDFRFSDGNKPLKADLRLSSDYGYIPIYPDDYIFFGQKLSYGILNDASGYPIAHAMHPQAVAKSHTTGSGEDVDNSKHGLLINDINDRSENRVFRAPAYFRNGVYGKSVNFNARAAFVDSYDFTVSGTNYQAKPHHNMTAIDFTGGNGDTHGYQGVVAGMDGDFTDRANGYHPLLDCERLDAIQTRGLTQNLLAYTPKADIEHTKNTQTNNVLVNYFRDPSYSEGQYRTVDVQNTSEIRGHVVQQMSTEGNYAYTSVVDHLLVDLNDFNAPMAYTFTSDKRMWYQRQPDNYADRTSGWEAISLPFTAEMLTTQDKGELTHFYTGSTVGHEYWLREYSGIVSVDDETKVATANFVLPSSTDLVSKTDANTFLYDYYYTVDTYKDANEDEYQKNYYQTAREYSSYPLYQKAKPYIIGLPGVRYFEFDLSGNFEPQNRLGTTDIEKLPAQVITLVSNTGVTVNVSDTELQSNKVTADSYTFMPSYLNEEVPATTSYPLNTVGNSFDVSATPIPVGAFRPYFTSAATSPSRQYRSIIINDLTDTTEFKADESINLSDRGEGLRVSGGNGTITIESGLTNTARVRIVNAVGITMASFMLEPGAIVTTQLVPGVYIVAGKKVTVR